MQVMKRWKSLSPVEQQIEMTLTGSDANVDRLVEFDNANHDLDYLGNAHRAFPIADYFSGRQ